MKEKKNYLRDMIAKELEALDRAREMNAGKEVTDAIQRRLDGFRDDLRKEENLIRSKYLAQKADDKEELNQRAEKISAILEEEKRRHPGFVGRFVSCRIKWKDNGDTCDVVIKMSSDFVKEEDDHIFYYIDSIRDLAAFTMEDGVAEFVVDIETINFFDKL